MATVKSAPRSFRRFALTTVSALLPFALLLAAQGLMLKRQADFIQTGTQARQQVLELRQIAGDGHAGEEQTRPPIRHQPVRLAAASGN